MSKSFLPLFTHTIVLWPWSQWQKQWNQQSSIHICQCLGNQSYNCQTCLPNQRRIQLLKVRELRWYTADTEIRDPSFFSDLIASKCLPWTWHKRVASPLKEHLHGCLGGSGVCFCKPSTNAHLSYLSIISMRHPLWSNSFQIQHWGTCTKIYINSSSKTTFKSFNQPFHRLKKKKKIQISVVPFIATDVPLYSHWNGSSCLTCEQEIIHCFLNHFQ